MNNKPAWLSNCLFLIALSLFGCSDKNSEPEMPYPGIDSFEGRIREFFLTDETDRFDANECNIKILAPDRSVISRFIFAV